MIKLYEYQHCPYCVRVKFFLKLFDISFNVEHLDYSDKVTPRQLTGNKSLPIIEVDDSTYMDESLDIIKYISKKFSIEHINNFLIRYIISILILLYHNLILYKGHFYYRETY